MVSWIETLIFVVTLFYKFSLLELGHGGRTSTLSANPLVNVEKNQPNSSFLMRKSTINGPLFTRGYISYLGVWSEQLRSKNVFDLFGLLATESSAEQSCNKGSAM